MGPHLCGPCYDNKCTDPQSHDDTSQSTDHGQLKVSLQFNITNDKKQIGDLVVTIISGHNLLQTELTCNPVVKW